jgi:RNA polymerase sigma factor (TIGR02999 family)
MSRRVPDYDSASENALRERRAIDAFFVSRYSELRRIAAGLNRNERNITLSPTALVNEAWLRLQGSPELGPLSAAAFKAIAARAMRRVLIDAARRRHAGKRTPEAVVTVRFDESVAPVAVEDEVLRLDAALRDLERLSPRQAAVVEGRYFGGLTVVELAEILGVSVTTVEREWRVARAWLRSQL